MLLLDDDPRFCDNLQIYLEEHGCAVDVVHDIETGLHQARTAGYCVFLLTLQLFKDCGFEVLRDFRKSCQAGIILLTRQEDDVEGILALEMGADDCVVKSINPRELLARIHAVQRRMRPHLDSCDRFLLGDVEVNRRSRSVLCNGHSLELTTMEFSLFETLVRATGDVVSRDTLAESVLGRKFNPLDRSLDMLVSRLRRKLQPAGMAGRLKTIRSLGYQFAASVGGPAQESCAPEGTTRPHCTEFGGR